MTMRRVAGLITLVVATAGVAGGQETGWRVLDVMRQQHDSLPITVRISYGAGELALHPAPAGLLYALHLRYSGSSTLPKVTYDPTAHVLDLGGSSVAISFPEASEGGELGIGLSPHVPIDLKLNFGAAEAKLQLGGLAIRQLDLGTGASSTTVRFDSPNATAMQNLALSLGAASFRATNLGNAHARRIEIHAGAGDVDLDFGGQWANDVTLVINAAIGAVHVHVPADVAVTTTAKSVLGTVDADAVKNTTTPPAHHLTIEGSATLGAIEVDRDVGGGG